MDIVAQPRRFPEDSHYESYPCDEIAMLSLTNFEHEGVLCRLAADSGQCTQRASTVGLLTGNHGTCGSADSLFSLWRLRL